MYGGFLRQVPPFVGVSSRFCFVLLDRLLLGVLVVTLFMFLTLTGSRCVGVRT